MTHPSIAVDAICMRCRADLLRTETAPGETLTIPDHACTDEAKEAADHG